MLFERHKLLLCFEKRKGNSKNIYSEQFLTDYTHRLFSFLRLKLQNKKKNSSSHVIRPVDRNGTPVSL